MCLGWLPGGGPQHSPQARARLCPAVRSSRFKKGTPPCPSAPTPAWHCPGCRAASELLLTGAALTPSRPPPLWPRARSDRSIHQPLELFRTRWKGWGVRCAADLEPGAFVATYEGELITTAEAVSASGGSRMREGAATAHGGKVAAGRLGAARLPGHAARDRAHVSPAWPGACGTVPSCPLHHCHLLGLQEERRGGDAYLFDLEHFVLVSCMLLLTPPDPLSAPCQL